MRAGYYASLSVMLVGFFAAVMVCIALPLNASGSATLDERTMGLAAETTVRLEARAYDVHFKTHESIDRVPTFTIEVFDVRSGQEVPVTRRNGALKVFDDDSRNSGQGTFESTRAGSYLIVTATDAKPIEAEIMLLPKPSDDEVDQAVRGGLFTVLGFTVAALLLAIMTALEPDHPRLDWLTD